MLKVIPLHAACPTGEWDVRTEADAAAGAEQARVLQVVEPPRMA